MRLGQPLEGLPGRLAPSVTGDHVSVLPPALALYRDVGRSRRHHPPRHPDAAAVSGEPVAQAGLGAAPRTRLARASPVSPNTGAVGSVSSGRISRRARAVAEVSLPPWSARLGSSLSVPSVGQCRPATAPRLPRSGPQPRSAGDRRRPRLRWWPGQGRRVCGRAVWPSA